MIQTAEQKAFAAVHLQGFKDNYPTQSALELLDFDENSGNFILRDGFSIELEDILHEAYHQVNTGWCMYKKGIVSQKQEIDQLKAKLFQACKLVNEAIELEPSLALGEMCVIAHDLQLLSEGCEGLVLVSKQLSDDKANKLVMAEFEKCKSLFYSEHRDMSDKDVERIKSRWAANRVAALKESYGWMIAAQGDGDE